ncbi:MAG TPA: ABC transporter permease [Candidatus Enterocloster excrementipullorum]|uniref:ABC transporter permease n=1 Tax=Candidatus Enterocloster excrementipullorum TaxID=2838559 RepID=A0A9D2MYZ4_9FIRM|nr:ABC transporter permease [Candidatus Enterocloster excrementipullorum]
MTSQTRKSPAISPSPAQQAFVEQEIRRRRQVTICRVMLLVLLLALWELASSRHWIDSFIFSSPSLIVKCLWDMAADGSLFLHSGVTLLETLASFGICTAASLACALALWSSKSLAQILEPFLVLLNSLPKSALAPLLIVWLGNNMRTIITAAVSVAVFGSILTLYTGFVQIDPEKIKLIRSLGGGQKDILFKVLLPGSLPMVISSMKVNIGLCLVGVIIGEFLSARAGLGYLITYGSQTFAMTMVVTSIVVLCFLSIVLYQCIAAVERRMMGSSK